MPGINDEAKDTAQGGSKVHDLRLGRSRWGQRC